MYWVKNRDAAENWTVYHQGLNSGTNPENRYIVLNSDGGESGSDTSAWDSFVPTSTNISFGTMDTTGGNSSHNYLVMLFASVSGISKVGSWTATGSSNTQTISTGFAPRFLIAKRANDDGAWFVLDTTRGWGSGDDEFLKLDSNAAQNGDHDLGAPTSTGFTVTSYLNLNTDSFCCFYHRYCYLTTKCTQKIQKIDHTILLVMDYWELWSLMEITFLLVNQVLH